MKIEINKDYYIVDDGNCFIPYRVGKVKKGENVGKLTEDNLGYYSKLAGAINAIVREEMYREEGELTLKEYVERYEKAFNELKEKLEK